jgi:Flp pilus assembly protein CpaB
VLLGIAFFVVGGIIVFLLTDDDDGGSGASAEVSAIVSNTDVPAGTLADDLIADGRLREIKVPANQLPPGALQSTNQLAGATFVQGFAKEQPITSGGLQLQNRTFDVPQGFEALAVQIDFVAGVAGYVNPGDHINLYTAYDIEYPLGGQLLPRAELLLSNVEVLDVDLTIPPRRGTVNSDGTARASGDAVTYLVAVRTDDAEKVVYSTEFQTLYATLADDETPPAGNTEGQDGDSITAGDPNVAN